MDASTCFVRHVESRDARDVCSVSVHQLKISIYADWLRYQFINTIHNEPSFFIFALSLNDVREMNLKMERLLFGSDGLRD